MQRLPGTVEPVNDRILVFMIELSLYPMQVDASTPAITTGLIPEALHARRVTYHLGSVAHLASAGSNTQVVWAIVSSVPVLMIYLAISQGAMN